MIGLGRDTAVKVAAGAAASAPVPSADDLGDKMEEDDPTSPAKGKARVEEDEDVFGNNGKASGSRRSASKA